MPNYDTFLKELSELCRKHDVEIFIDCHSVELALDCASRSKNRFPNCDSVIDKDYQIKDIDNLHFSL